ncbi:MAG: hypothetical protein M3115_07015 [Thermoproteota archaeon]|nr:hypothetical protein [Thermoproteota archaeon]
MVLLAPPFATPRMWLIMSMLLLFPNGFGPLNVCISGHHSNKAITPTYTDLQTFTIVDNLGRYTHKAQAKQIMELID